MPYNRQTWDLTAVLYAVEREKNFFGYSEWGTLKIDDTGATTFTVNAKGKHRHLTVNKEQASRIQKYFIQLIIKKHNLKSKFLK